MWTRSESAAVVEKLTAEYLSRIGQEFFLIKMLFLVKSEFVFPPIISCLGFLVVLLKPVLCSELSSYSSSSAKTVKFFNCWPLDLEAYVDLWLPTKFQSFKHHILYLSPFTA